MKASWAEREAFVRQTRSFLRVRGVNKLTNITREGFVITNRYSQLYRSRRYLEATVQTQIPQMCFPMYWCFFNIFEFAMKVRTAPRDFGKRRKKVEKKKSARGLVEARTGRRPQRLPLPLRRGHLVELRHGPSRRLTPHNRGSTRFFFSSDLSIKNARFAQGRRFCPRPFREVARCQGAQS